MRVKRFATIEDAVDAVRAMSEKQAEADDRWLCTTPLSGAFVDPQTPAVLATLDGLRAPDGLQPMLEVAEVWSIVHGAAKVWGVRGASRAALVGAVAYYVHHDACAPTEKEALEFLRPPKPLQGGAACLCSAYDAHDPATARGTADRQAHARQLIDALRVVAKHPGECLTLYRCPACGRMWQDRCGGDFLFVVAAIKTEEWLEQPYADILMWLGYVGQRATFLATADRTERDVGCRSAGCARRAIVHSVFCLEHHFETIAYRPEGRPLA